MHYMGSEQIKSIFGAVDFDSEKPAYRQLEENLAAFIKNAADNTPIPSEREVSALLKINRRTLRKAIDPFVKSGLLSRGIKGTIVKKRNLRSLSAGDSMVHPFNFGTAPFFCPGKTIRFALYENMRIQKGLWNSLVETFNSEGRASNIELEWIPLSVTTPEAYRTYIQENKPDIVQVSLAASHQELVCDMADEFPEDIGELLFSSGNCWTHLYKNNSTPVVPVHFSLHASFCNMELLEKVAGKKIKNEPSEIEDILSHIHLPENVKAARHIEDLYGSLSVGTVPADYDEKNTASFFKRKFEYVVALPQNASSWLAVPINEKIYDIYKSMNLFADGHTFSTSAFPMFIADCVHKIGFSYSVHIPDARALTGISGIAVNSSSENKEYSWDFARFLLSEKIQRLFSEKLKNAAILKNANGSLASFFGKTPEDFDLIVSMMKTATPKDHEFGWKLAEARSSVYHKLYNKEINVRDAVELTINKLKKENFL